MFSAKISIVVVLMVWFVLVSQCDAWRRRRRRRCPVRDCDITSWSYWSWCSTDQCGQQGYQSRSRMIVSQPSCGGATCPDNRYETRQCYGSRAVDCDLSYWSEWSACTTVCGVSGMQTSSRHRITTEQCGGSCTSTFSKTRSCPQISCLNGGSLKDGTCFCKEGYSGSCCEKQGETQHCSGTTPVDCQLSSWSEWSACNTVCGVSGKRTSSRHRITTEQCGGTCTSNFSITRPCEVLSCLNGGSLRDQLCFCTEGYSGDCCEKKDTSSITFKTIMWPWGTTAVVGLIILCVLYKCCCQGSQPRGQVQPAVITLRRF